MMSWVLQYLVGFQRLGHDVYFVEKSGYANSCFDPTRNVMSDDCSYGVAAVNGLLGRFGSNDRWCFVDERGSYYGLSRGRVQELFGSADLFLDMGTHGAWLDEAAKTRLRILEDGEPGFTQMKMQNRLDAGEPLPAYDYSYTAGINIGTNLSTVPTAGRAWRLLFHPVVTDLFEAAPVRGNAPFTTVMNWQSHQPIEFRGKIYGQKDLEFAKFFDLPRRSAMPLEIAVAGNNVPTERLIDCGWRIRDAHEVTRSFDSFCEYIRASMGEFSVCKNVFVDTRSGWFSDRSAAYLASARPVVLQDTGFSEHLPCGEGLLAVSNVHQAATALDAIQTDYTRHATAARQIAREHLDASRVLRQFLSDLGV